MFLSLPLSFSKKYKLKINAVIDAVVITALLVVVII